MLKNNRFAILTALALAVVAVSGCPTKEAMPDNDAAPPNDAGSDDVPDASTPDTSNLGKPLAYGCSAGAECSSGFCVDGVCCDSACDQQCATCGLTGWAGHCSGQISGDDTEAAVPCDGAKTCGLDPTSPTLAGCKLRDGQKCSSATDCASLNCVTFYEDLDGDGYGSGNTLKLCEALGAVAPAGYSTVSGDCCDYDIYTHPGQTDFFTAENICGSWDFDCDGTIEIAFTCPGTTAPAICGTKPPTSGGLSCIAVHPDSTHCH